MIQAKSIKTLIQQGNIQQAIEQTIELTRSSGSRYQNEAILHAATYRSLQDDLRRGMLAPQDQDMQRRRLIDGLLGLLDEIESEHMSNVGESVDILLVVATKIEMTAVLGAMKHLTGLAPTEIVRGDKTYWLLEQLGGARVGLVWSEMGSVGPGGTSLTIFEAAHVLNPRSIVLVGIAFGTKPDKQQIGDILVSERIMNYAQQRAGTGDYGDFNPIPRGDRTSASIKLLDRFRHADLTWRGAPVRFGLLLSGPALVDNLAYRQSLQQFEPEAIGGEMEGAGLYDVAQRMKIDWIIVKAICDWADGHKGHNKDEYQAIAARNAAEFTIHTLTLGGLQ